MSALLLNNPQAAAFNGLISCTIGKVLGQEFLDLSRNFGGICFQGEMAGVVEINPASASG